MSLPAISLEVNHGTVSRNFGPSGEARPSVKKEPQYSSAASFASELMVHCVPSALMKLPPFWWTYSLSPWAL